MNYKRFKELNQGGYVTIAAGDIPGFAKKGDSLYGDCDYMKVVDFIYLPLLGIYTVYLTNPT